MTTKTAMSAADWAILIVLAIVWGGSFFFYKVLVTELPPFTIAFGRLALAGLALNLILAVRGEALWRTRLPWHELALLGLLNNAAPFVLIAFGETRIASGTAAILNATTPIFTIIAAHFLTRDERLTGAKAIGVGCGFAGVAVLVGPSAMRGFGGSLIAEAACLTAAFSYALAGLYGRRFHTIAPLQLATGQITASAILLAPLAAAIDRPWRLSVPSAAVWAALAAIAIVSTAFAYILYFRLLGRVGATNLLLVTFLLPITALALGAGLLGEAITARAIGGMLLIGLGFAAIDGRPWRALTARRRPTRPFA